MGVLVWQEHPKSRDNGPQTEAMPQESIHGMWQVASKSPCPLAISSAIRGRWLPANPLSILRDVHPLSKHENETQNIGDRSRPGDVHPDPMWRTRLGPGLASTISDKHFIPKCFFRQHYVFFCFLGWVGLKVFRAVLFRIVRYMARDSNHVLHHFGFVCVRAIRIWHVFLLPLWGGAVALLWWVLLWSQPWSL